MLSKLNQNYLFCLLMVLIPILTFSQTGTIIGKIYDSQTKEELIGATTQLDSTNIFALSDEQGNFIFSQLEPGKYSLTSAYFSYLSDHTAPIEVKPNDTVYVEVALKANSFELNEVQITAKVNRELENILLIDQKNALNITQKIGASELSRKGIGNVESAVSSIAGISKQEGVKNVFIRGLGDRYNTTLLNGLSIPSEDPEFKNISLTFFESEIIKNVSVDKVFLVNTTSDVSGAVININSKELNNKTEFRMGLTVGGNQNIPNSGFMIPDGVGKFGLTQINRPSSNTYSFVNKLDPSQINFPLNLSFNINGGRQFRLNNNDKISIFTVLSHSNEYFYTKEFVRNTTTDGTVYQDQEGDKFSNNQTQLFLTNINYDRHKVLKLDYNLMLIHANQNYLGEFYGRNSEKFQDADDDSGYLRRQQINDNWLITNQILSSLQLSEKASFKLATALNTVIGNEPDRRENYLSTKEDGSLGLTGSNRQKRFFSELNGVDYNIHASFNYSFNDVVENNKSLLTIGYSLSGSQVNFQADEYNFSAVTGSTKQNEIQLDKFYNLQNFNDNKFHIAKGYPSGYDVFKNTHSLFLQTSYQFSNTLGGSIGLKYGRVNTKVMYDVPGQTGENKLNNNFFLPSFNLKYEIDQAHTLRLGTSKTYTLPQSKEISPYQYVNIGFASEGNPRLKHSENFNIDVKWDYFLNNNEFIAATVFYKNIKNPIGRVDKGNSAGLLTYENIAQNATVTGIEAEIRKDLIHFHPTQILQENRISLGTNLSYIITSAQLSLLNTPTRNTALEGASPWLLNIDITHHYSKNSFHLSSLLLLKYFSDRIYTIGTMGYHDIIEKAVPTLDFVMNAKFDNNLSIKLKVGNILNPSYQLTREIQPTKDVVILNHYQKGITLNFGVTYAL